METQRNTAGFAVEFLLLSVFYFMLPTGSMGSWFLLVGTVLIRARWGITLIKPKSLLPLMCSFFILAIGVMFVTRMTLEFEQFIQFRIFIEKEIPNLILLVFLVITLEKIDVDDFLCSLQQKSKMLVCVAGALITVGSVFSLFPEITNAVNKLYETAPISISPILERSISLRSDYNMFATGLLISAIVCVYSILFQKKYSQAVLLFLFFAALILLIGSRRAVVSFVVGFAVLLATHPSMMKTRKTSEYFNYKKHKNLSMFFTPRISAAVATIFLAIPLLAILFLSSASLDDSYIAKSRIAQSQDIETLTTSLDRNGLITWGLGKLSRSSNVEFAFGSGADYLDDLAYYSDNPSDWAGTREWNNYKYIHNPMLGTFLMFGLLGFVSAATFVLLSIFSLILTKCRDLIAITIPIICILVARASMSGNTILSPVVLCGFLLICANMSAPKNSKSTNPSNAM